ncbi:MAG: hypothetical protein LBU67_01860 [Oscillospiraceae bacterium]|jgi:tetratricopeptide (TPR) repeat protein|nr:hypothetical protein [Oscillospiraceae bacterium]
MSEKHPEYNVVPFARGPAYLRARAMDHQRAGRMLEALELLRVRAGRDPGDARMQLDLADQYAQMGAYELANRSLFALLQRGECPTDCLMALAENFYAQQDATRAMDCLLAAMRLRPQEEQAERIGALLDELEEEEASPPRGRAVRAMRRGMRALETGEPQAALRWIGYAITHGVYGAGAYALRAFAYLAAEDPRRALQDARRAHRIDGQDVQALCAMACALHALGSGVLSAAFLDKGYACAKTSQDYALLCQSACETGHHDLVLQMLSTLRHAHPYAPQLLHMLAVAYWNTGQVLAAVQQWGTLRRIDAENPVIACLHRQAKEQLAQGDVQEPPPEALSYRMELPVTDCVDHLMTLHRAVQGGPDALCSRLAEDESLVALLRWALSIQDEGSATRRTVLALLASLPGAQPEKLLLEVLTDLTHGEDNKRQALAALAARGRTGPYYVDTQGHLRTAMVRATRVKVPLAPSCERVLQGATDRLAPKHGDVANALTDILLPYVCGRLEPGAPLRHPHVWVAALEYAYHLRHGGGMALRQRCARLGVSLRLLKKYAGRLLRAADAAQGGREADEVH